MIQSNELINLIRNWYASLSSDIHADTTERLFSRQAGFLAVGTGPNEWWHESSILTRNYRASAEKGGIEVAIIDIEGFCEGSVGWVMSKVIYGLPGGKKIPIRQTFILHQEDRGWKVIHAHGSIGVFLDNVIVDREQ